MLKYSKCVQSSTPVVLLLVPVSTRMSELFPDDCFSVNEFIQDIHIFHSLKVKVKAIV